MGDPTSVYSTYTRISPVFKFLMYGFELVGPRYPFVCSLQQQIIS